MGWWCALACAGGRRGKNRSMIMRTCDASYIRRKLDLTSKKVDFDCFLIAQGAQRVTSSAVYTMHRSPGKNNAPPSVAWFICKRIFLCSATWMRTICCGWICREISYYQYIAYRDDYRYSNGHGWLSTFHTSISYDIGADTCATHLFMRTH